MLTKPKAIIFDLDDTLIMSDGTVRKTWEEVCKKYQTSHPDIDREELFEKIREIAVWYWSDKTRHREGRINMDHTRRTIAIKAFEQLGLDDEQGAITMADRFSELRYSKLELFPGSIELLKMIRQAEIGLGLLTNGESKMQRRKIEQFNLAPYFNVIQVEGEAGVGKPEVAAYELILKSLGTRPEETWIVGDNLEWEVIVPQQLGLTAIWHNYYQKEISDPDVVPDRTLSVIAELAAVLTETLSN
ncbi:MAG: HAD family hydrolase [Proteobacteria bacterium]|nr:HAD family hydrolase [Pseudomonadota bacterium]